MQWVCLTLVLSACTSAVSSFTLRHLNSTDGLNPALSSDASPDSSAADVAVGQGVQTWRGASRLKVEELGFPPTPASSDSQPRQPGHHTTSKQVTYKEVISKLRQHTGSGYKLDSEKKFEESKRVLRDEHSVYRNVGHSEALSQEVRKSDLKYSLPKMVVVATTTVAALFGMCVMAAIFQCCCRKKRTSSDSDVGEAVKSSGEKKSKSPTPDKDTKPDEHTENTENDKLLEDEDLGDFSVVQRETEILKSYRKPPPPKNRARASRVPRMKAAGASPAISTKTEEDFSLIKEEPEGSIRSKSNSLRSSPEKQDDKDNKDTEETKDMSDSVHTEDGEAEKEDKRLSFEDAKKMVDSMLAEVKEKSEKGEINLSVTDSEQTTKTSSEESAHVNGIQTAGGNIFMQIDPTVKIEDPSEKKSKIPVRASNVSPSSIRKEGPSLRPTSANKEQRKFLVPSVHGEQMDQLVKSLKTRLKEDKGTSQCVSARNLTSADKEPVSGSEDDMDPKSRERSQSDPTKQLIGLKGTHV